MTDTHNDGPDRRAFATQTLRTLRCLRDDLDNAEQRWIQDVRAAAANGVHFALGHPSMDSVLQEEFGLSAAGMAPGRRLWLDPDPAQAALAVARRFGPDFARALADALRNLGGTTP
jgi:hypothetical protein